MSEYLEIAASIPGWRGPVECAALYEQVLSLPPNPVIVEIGVFLGRSTALMAGARKLRGSGKVHCIDPFDCSGDAFSVPHYRGILAEQGGGSLRAHFEENIRGVQLLDWISVHQGTAEAVALDWKIPVDLLLLDADQSPTGARQAYELWLPHLKEGGVIVLGNTTPHDSYPEGHDGNRRLARGEIRAPQFFDIRQIGSTLFARKAPTHERPRDREPGDIGTPSPRVHLYAQCWNDEFMLPFFSVITTVSWTGM